jgi:hypothetical protein
MSPDRRSRRLTTVTLTLALALTAALAPTPARAQDEPATQGEGSGRPLDGYLATLCFAAAVLFAVGKSARR